MNHIEHCVPHDITVRDAMRRLDELQPKLLILTDEKNRLVGTLTDGDVRRFFLSGGKMDDAAELAVNPAPLYTDTMERARRLYTSNHFFVIPIVNQNREVTDVFLGPNVQARPHRQLNVPVVINAGGKGARLEPYTRVLPKPLIPVGELPIIELIMRRFGDYGCNAYHVITNYKKRLLKAYFAENEKHYQINWYDEERPLGTGGGLGLLRGKLKETFFFTNCDILLEIDYEKLLAFHRENKNRITMVCAYKNLTVPYGVIEMGVGGRIISMQEKPELSFLTNTGLYVVEPQVLDDIEPDKAIGFPDIIELQRKWGYAVAAYPVSENDWLDMGQLEELERMKAWLDDR